MKADGTFLAKQAPLTTPNQGRLHACLAILVLTVELRPDDKGNISYFRYQPTIKTAYCIWLPIFAIQNQSPHSEDYDSR